MAAKVFVDGLQQAGRTPTRNSLIAELESIQKTDFDGFHVDFGSRKHEASSYVDLSLLTHDGKVLR